jgi:hypothetical protein
MWLNIVCVMISYFFLELGLEMEFVKNVFYFILFFFRFFIVYKMNLTKLSEEEKLKRKQEREEQKKLKRIIS